MEYTTPVLQIVGTAQMLVLGGQSNLADNSTASGNTHQPFGIIGLDD